MSDEQFLDKLLDLIRDAQDGGVSNDVIIGEFEMQIMELREQSDG